MVYIVRIFGPFLRAVSAGSLNKYSMSSPDPDLKYYFMSWKYLIYNIFLYRSLDDPKEMEKDLVRLQYQVRVRDKFSASLVLQLTGQIQFS